MHCVLEVAIVCIVLPAPVKRSLVNMFNTCVCLCIVSCSCMLTVEEESWDWTRTYHFPVLPLRQRRHGRAASKELSAARPSTKCNKDYTGHRALSPGLCLILCEHGVCYGFEALTRHESCAVVFRLLDAHFAKMPGKELVIVPLFVSFAIHDRLVMC